jgi:arabinoxylan arabinofuranohydrolase
VLANPPQNVNNNNHHSIVSYAGNWYIAYHNRAAALANGLSNAEAVYKRSLCLDAVNYNPDGSIPQTSPTTDGLAQLKNLNPASRRRPFTGRAASGRRCARKAD